MNAIKGDMDGPIYSIVLNLFGIFQEFVGVTVKFSHIPRKYNIMGNHLAKHGLASETDLGNSLFDLLWWLADFVCCWFFFL